MRRLFALALAVCLWFSFVPTASADVAGLTPCSESARFIQRANAATTDQAKARFERYSQALCGEEGLPHLIVDGRLSHAGDFTIPAIMFLYIAGCIGWAGRSYLIGGRSLKDPAEEEIIINIPRAIASFLGAAAWPLAALGEFTSGKLLAKADEITVSPR
ncbi:MAG: Photosystem I reaction center subunit III [Synechococcales cyanobacterium CRU_2_2]|nr:Photosystem I reaction center subunit III [Synechococcales cyanobacterium CRU_2_2]